ncbi:hypothetical protein SBC1_26360 [Caballeronia sp. SBC1]|nr:hypothetical protein SBC1_26360 [Caballeronia sp. SBC1]
MLTAYPLSSRTSRMAFSAGEAPICPSTGQGPATIRRFAHEQDVTGVIKDGAANVEPRICVAFFTSEKVHDLFCLHICELGKLGVGDTQHFFVALPVESLRRIMQSGLRNCQLATRLRQSTFRQFSRSMHRLPLLTDAHKSVLRCFLAVSDVAALSLQGSWLSNDHLVESTRIWLQQNALTASWLERIEVVAQAREIARKVVGCGLSDSDDARPEQLFTTAMTVKYGSPMVAKIWRRCNSAVSH